MSFRSRFGSGFPFNDTEGHGLRARQRLDELAQRHPEFAAHLNPDTWGRSRASATATAASGAGEDPFARFRNRARFEDFGFPFDDDFTDPHRFERYYQQQQDSKQPAQPQQQATNFAKPPVAPESGKKLHQSSTVDLGQPQAPLVDETRSQRSMSAPPEHPKGTSGKRFVSSVNIPIVNADMGGSTSQPQAQPQQQQQQQQVPPSSSEPSHGAPKERIIPIHIEGRDEVVMPTAAAQPERAFGQRSGVFTPYVNAQEHAQEEIRHQEELRRQQQQQKYQEYMRQQQQQQQQQQPQQSEPPQPPAAPPKAKPSSLELIQHIQKDVSELMTQVANFDGKPRDKKYLYLDEMLTRKMLLLDDIETGGQDAIRKARKEAIKCIQDTIKVLETKAQANDEAASSAAAAAQPTPASLSAEPMEVVSEAVVATPPAQPAQHEAAVEAAPVEEVTTTIEEVTPASEELRKDGVLETPMDVEVPAESSANSEQSKPAAVASEQQQPVAEAKEGGASETKRVKKKAEKK